MLAAAQFNLLDEFNILRIICGVFFIPHIYAKYFVPAALGFFVAAGFNPPATWMYIAGGLDGTRHLPDPWAVHRLRSLGGGVSPVRPAAGVYRTSGGKWLWNIGGYEFCLFWAICCVVVAMHG